MEKKGISEEAVAVLTTTGAAMLVAEIESKNIIRKLNVGPGTGTGRRKKLPPLEPVDKVLEWKQAGGSVFRNKTGFTYPEFRSLFRMVEPELTAPRNQRNTPKPPTGKGAGRKRKITPENELAMCLYWLRHAPLISDVGPDFGYRRANESLKHTVAVLLLALKHLIRFPSKEEQAELRDLEAWPPFKGAVGAGDGTYSQETRKKGDYSGHRGMFVRNAQVSTATTLALTRRHCLCASQVIVAVTGRIIYVRSGLPGSQGDAQQLLDGSILEAIDKESVILADSAYANLPGVLAAGSPEAREHVKEFTRWRSRVEHLFAVLKGNFHILAVKWHAPAALVTQSQAFYASCLLYNLKFDFGHFKPR